MARWPAASGGWPVLWLLDGEDNFAIAAMTARRLTKAGPRTGLQPGLIVAVESGSLARRVLDYTPAVPGYAIPASAPASGLATGGADAFLALLETGIAPQIAARWPIDATRQTLMGHSFGGLFALHALAHGGPWTRYVAVSASLWFGQGAVQRDLEQATLPHARLLMAAGDREGGLSAGPSPADDLARALSARGVQARAMVLPGQSHGSTMMAAMIDGLTMAFGKDA
jgi:predicted alpha/beta superfamily hydrolase